MFGTLMIGLAFAILLNAVIFLIAFKTQSDKLTDITYSLTFIFLVAYSFAVGMGKGNVYKSLILVLIVAWALRLGGFLLFRIHAMGKDARFDAFRHKFWRFFRFFMLQGIGAWIIALPAMIALIKYAGDSREFSGLTVVEITGLIIAMLGLAVESLADFQKYRFKQREGQTGKLYTGGLFSIVRYPNYSGEILFWVGIFIAAASILNGVEWSSILGLVTIITLLLFVSGVPQIESSRRKLYGSSESYNQYRRNTKKIIPGIY